jgi:DNA invertase Pin-like site-specific DNA recombinase
MEANVEFRACDLPDASRFILHIMAAVAEQKLAPLAIGLEPALQAAKARGVALGARNRASRNLSDEARRRGAQRTAEAAAMSYCEVLPRVRELRARGLSLLAIATELDTRGFFTRRGCR